MAELEIDNNDSKKNHSSYVSSLKFYLKNGFSVCNEIRIE